MIWKGFTHALDNKLIYIRVGNGQWSTVCLLYSFEPVVQKYVRIISPASSASSFANFSSFSYAMLYEQAFVDVEVDMSVRDVVDSLERIHKTHDLSGGVALGNFDST